MPALVNQPLSTAIKLFPHKVHLYIFLGFTLIFRAITLRAMLHGTPDDWRENKNYTATLLTVSGPFTGAIARPTQADCLKFAWTLFPWCAAVLAAAALCQLVVLPFQRGAIWFRLTTWVVGWLGWYAGSFLSLVYALS